MVQFVSCQRGQQARSAGTLGEKWIAGRAESRQQATAGATIIVFVAEVQAERGIAVPVFVVVLIQRQRRPPCSQSLLQPSLVDHCRSQLQESAVVHWAGLLVLNGVLAHRADIM